MSARDRIVVGVDGSANADVALSWAYEQARATGADLDVVSVWSTPALGDIVAMAAEGTFSDLEEAARTIVDDAIHRVIGRRRGEKVHRVVAHGYPPTELVRLSEGARMLVVGTRGHGALRDLVLGSVSHSCADRATCPVVIIPSGDRADRARLDAAIAERKSRADAPRPVAAALTPSEGELG